MAAWPHSRPAPRTPSRPRRTIATVFSAGAQRPDVVSNPNLPSEKRALSSWFNTAAFAQPAAYTFGNAGIGVVRRLGLMNIDFSVLRHCRVTERLRAELRGEFFNTLNHTNFGNPGATFGSSTFGVIGSATGAPDRVRRPNSVLRRATH